MSETRYPPAEPRNVYRWIVIVAAIAGIAWIGYRALPPRVNTDLGDYAWMKSQVAGRLDLHFPDEPPAGSKVSYLPAFLQGGGHFQLRVPASPGEIAHVEAIAKRRAAGVFPGGGAQFDTPIPTTSDFTGGKGVIPATFTHYVLVAARDWDYAYGEGSEPALEWGHASTAGVSISPSTGEIIYWAEWW